MLKSRLALSAAITFALAPLPAFGQGFSHPPGLSPSITPAMIPPASFGPLPDGTSRFGRPGTFNYGYGGYGYGGYGGYGYYPGTFIDYGYALPRAFTTSPPSSPPFAAPLEGTAPTALDPAAALLDMPTTGEVTIEFPAEVALTVDGVSVPGSGRERTVTSKPLRPGDAARLAVRATWTTAGARYEWDRVLTISRGSRGRLTVARGFPAK